MTFLLTLNPHRLPQLCDAGRLLGTAARTGNPWQSEPQMHIRKEDDPYVRTLLVQGAQPEIGIEELSEGFAGPNAALAAGRAHAGVGFGNQDERENGGGHRQASPKDDGSVGPQGGVYNEVFHKWRETERVAIGA